MLFRLTPRSMTLDDLDMLYLEFSRLGFRGISQISEPTTAKRMKIDPCCTFQQCIGLDYVDIIGRSSTRGRQTLVGWGKQAIFSS